MMTVSRLRLAEKSITSIPVKAAAKPACTMARPIYFMTVCWPDQVPVQKIVVAARDKPGGQDCPEGLAVGREKKAGQEDKGHEVNSS